MRPWPRGVAGSNACGPASHHAVAAAPTGTRSPAASQVRESVRETNCSPRRRRTYNVRRPHQPSHRAERLLAPTPRESGMSPLRARTFRGRRRSALSAAAVFVVTLALATGVAQAKYQPGEPPGVDPGTPPFTGSSKPIPDEPA